MSVVLYRKGQKFFPLLFLLLLCMLRLIGAWNWGLRSFLLKKARGCTSWKICLCLTWPKCEVDTHKCVPCVLTEEHFTNILLLLIFVLIPPRAPKYTVPLPFRNKLSVERPPANNAGRWYTKLLNTQPNPAQNTKVERGYNDAIVRPSVIGAGKDRGHREATHFFSESLR